MSIGIFVLLLAIIGIAGLAFWIWSLVDALQRPDSEWERAGQNKLVWIVVLILAGFIGSIIYLVVARPALEDAKRIS